MRYLLPFLLLLLGTAAYAQMDSIRQAIRQANPINWYDSVRYYQGKADGLQTQIDNEKKTTPVVPLIISVISTLVALSALAYTYSNYRREGAYKRVNFAAEVNKLQLANPDLRAMYDAEEERFLQHFSVEGAHTFAIRGTYTMKIQVGTQAVVSGDGTLEIEGVKHLVSASQSLNKQFMGGETIIMNGNLSFQMTPAGSFAQVQLLTPELDAKIRAFGFFLINNFEVLFNRTKLSRKPEAKYWEAYCVALMKRSNRFTNQVAEVLNHTEAQFHTDYIQRLRSLHELAIKKS